MLSGATQVFGSGIPNGNLIEKFLTLFQNGIRDAYAQFAKAAMNKTDIVLHTAGKSVGNYCYTRDAVMGILLLLVKGNDGEAYTVAHPEAHITIGDMAKMVAEKLANNEIKVVFDIPESAMTFGYAPDVNMRLNSDKLQALGWKPVIGLEEMYTRMMKSMEYTR